MLPALYEVRNNRGVGHVGGDVDPNHMDATVVIAMCNWILAEMVRVMHSLSISEAQVLVDGIAERRVPLVWQLGEVRRLLDPDIRIRDALLILLSSSNSPVNLETIRDWAMYDNKQYFNRMARELEQERKIFISKEGTAQILPPGMDHVTKILRTRGG
jgi:hypothetical protein